MANDKITVDLSNYKERVGARVPEDTYRVVVEDAELDQAKSGNEMINLWFRIVGGPEDGSTLVDRLVLTEKSLFRVVGFMQAIGLPTPKKRLQLNLKQFINKQLEVTVEDDTYQGRTRSAVRGYAKVAKASKATETEDLDEDAEESSEAPEVEPKTENPSKTEAESKSKSDSDDSDDSQGEVDLDDLDNL